MKTLKTAGAALIVLLAIIGLVSLISYFLGSKSGISPDIAPFEKEIIMLRREVDSLQVVVERLQTDGKVYEDRIDSLNSQFSILNSQLHENRQNHENAIVRIDGMSADDLFRFFTDYLSSNEGVGN